MAVIRPFQAVRPVKGRVAEVAALPYDVYNREEAKEAVKDKPYSFLRIDRAETQFGDEVDTYAPCVYEKASEIFEGMCRDGVYLTEDRPCYYVYELVMNGRSQTGITACASIDDYQNGIIKKHENTREEKEIDRRLAKHYHDAFYAVLRLYNEMVYTLNKVIPRDFLFNRRKDFNIISEEKVKNFENMAVGEILDAVEKNFRGNFDSYLGDYCIPSILLNDLPTIPLKD